MRAVYFQRLLYILLIVYNLEFVFSTPSLDSSFLRKVDPVLRQCILLEKIPPSLHIYHQLTERDDGWMDVFVHLQNPEVSLTMDGIHAHSCIGNIVTASLAMSSIQNVLQNTNIRHVEMARICHPTLDISIPEIGVNQIWEPISGKGYEGEGVIIGIYDSGIDWTHSDFIGIDDSTRILAIWDQTDLQTGPPPSGFVYGTEYSRNQINEELFGGHTGVVLEKDTWGHGSHVAGIAAGNGLATGNGQPPEVYRGVAPKADLIVVKGFDQGDAIFDTRVVDGVRYLFQKAQELNRPIVVNLSLGRRDGPHDGSSWFEQSLTNLYFDGGAIQGGRAIVTSAGNDGERGIHGLMDFESTPENESTDIEFQVTDNPEYSLDFVLVEGWFSGNSELEIIIETPEGVTVGPIFPGVVTGFPSLELSMIYIEHAVGGIQSNGDKRIYLSITDVGNTGEIENFPVGTWKLHFSNGSGRFDLWIYETTVDCHFTKGIEFSTMIVEPGNGPFVITVGSYISRVSWPSLIGDYDPQDGLVVGHLSKFSNPGPTRPSTNDPLPANKPEIVAPGESILSSLSVDMINRPNDSSIGPDGVHFAWKGTSMAAAHVSGLVALMFEANPELTVSEITSHLILTARKDPLMGDKIWSSTWGYGKLDGIAAINRTTVRRNQCPMSGKTFSFIENYPNPFNSNTVIHYQLKNQFSSMAVLIKLQVCDILGRTIRTLVNEEQTTGYYMVTWNGTDQDGKQVGSGVYLYILQIGEQFDRGKMVYLR